MEFVKDQALGDMASNVAFLLARAQGRNPMEIAAELVGRLTGRADFEKVTVGGRGFVNFTISRDWLIEGLRDAMTPDFGRSAAGRGEKLLVEYVSANPTGPLNVVNAGPPRSVRPWWLYSDSRAMMPAANTTLTTAATRLSSLETRSRPEWRNRRARRSPYLRAAIPEST